MLKPATKKQNKKEEKQEKEIENLPLSEVKKDIK